MLIKHVKEHVCDAEAVVQQQAYRCAEDFSSPFQLSSCLLFACLRFCCGSFGSSIGNAVLTPDSSRNENGDGSNNAISDIITSG